jgi:hypothetical protein
MMALMSFDGVIPRRKARARKASKSDPYRRDEMLKVKVFLEEVIRPSCWALVFMAAYTVTV